MRMLDGITPYTREFINLPKLVRNLTRHRQLVYTLTWRDFTARYRGSFGGLFWSFFQPLVMMVIYTIVFSLFLKVRFSTNESPFTFSLYLLCGLLPWNAFSEALMTSTGVIRANVNLVKRVVFPLEILPLNVVFVAVIQQLVGFVLLVPLVRVVTGRLFWTILLVPIILVLQLILTIGMAWIVASLAVYIPDLPQLVGLMLAVWMFLTPVFYPEDVVPPTATIILRWNPMAHLVGLYRKVFMEGNLFSLKQLVVCFVFFLLLFQFGYFWFMHSKKGFADVL